MRYLYGERLYKETLLARPEIKATNILTFTIPLGYINSSTLSWIAKLYENTYNITIETSLDNGETWRPQLPGEQIPGLAEISITKPTKLLIRAIVDTTNTINPADIANITLDIDYSAIGHYAICSDGRAYFNGQEISGEPDFIDLSNGELKIKGGRKVDELYVTPRLLTKEEIDLLHQTQYELQDPKESIDTSFRKISHLSGEIDADGHTIYASIHGENKIVSHYGIDPETGDRGLFIYDIDEQGNPVEVGFTGRRGDGTVIGFGEGGGFTPGADIVTGNITPATDNLSIGTPDNRFASIYADEIHTSAVKTETVEVKDNIIVLNKGQVGSGVSAGLAGIKVDRGDAPDYMIVFDEEEDMFKVGMLGDLETIASQNYVQRQLESVVKDADSLGGIPAEEFLNSRIVEEGYNENGWYIRWGNGLQMCGRLVNLVFTTTDVQQWSYPASFTQVYFGTCSSLKYGIDNNFRDALSSLVLWARQTEWTIKLGKTSTVFYPDVGLFTLGRWK